VKSESGYAEGFNTWLLAIISRWREIEEESGTNHFIIGKGGKMNTYLNSFQSGLAVILLGLAVANQSVVAGFITNTVRQGIYFSKIVAKLFILTCAPIASRV